MQYRYKIEPNKSKFCTLLTDIINIVLTNVGEEEMDILIDFKQYYIGGGIKRIVFYYLENNLEYYRY